MRRQAQQSEAPVPEEDPGEVGARRRSRSSSSNSTSRGKRETLRKLLRDPEVRNAIVFCNRKKDVRELADVLKKAGFSAGQIHGDMEQGDRIRELDRFKSGEILILVASDVAARGLDVPGVSHVVNYDVPHHAEDYVHRIGRTGRAGRTGIAYTIATEDEADNLREVEKLIGHKVPRHGAVAAAPAEVAEVAEVLEVPAETIADEPEAPHDAAAPEPRSHEATGDGERRKRRRRGGKGRRKSGEAGEPAERAAPPAEPRQAAAPAEARPVEQRPAPSRDRAPRERRPRDREPARDRGGREYRDDLGPSFVGFGDEGIPAFLQHRATL